MFDKVVYHNIQALLQEKCPLLYNNYMKLLSSKDNSLMILKDKGLKKVKAEFLNTDIYLASMEINKMQRLNSNILSIWVEPHTNKLGNNQIIDDI